MVARCIDSAERRRRRHPDDFVARIADLRGRVTRGELDGRESFRAGVGELAVEQAAHILPADVVQGHNLTPDRRRDSFNVERRRHLLFDMLRLREQIG